MTFAAGPLTLGLDPAHSAAALCEPVAFTVQPPKDDEDGGRGADFGKSSPVGLLVLLLFFIAVAFLVRSMTKHLKRLPASFDPAEDSPAEPEDSPDSTDAVDSADSSVEQPKASPANGTSDPT